MSAQGRLPMPDETPVSIGDDHKTHAWGKWRQVSAGLFGYAEWQLRQCVICNFTERVLTQRVK